MGVGEGDTDAKATRCAQKGVADVGDTLLGNFLQGVSTVAREEPVKKQSSSRVQQNGEPRRNGEKKENRIKGEEKRRRSKERLEGKTTSDRLESKEKHKKKKSKHRKTSHDKKNGYALRKDPLNSDADSSKEMNRCQTSVTSCDVNTSWRADSVFELAFGGRENTAVVKRLGQGDAPETKSRNGGILYAGRAEQKEEKASNHRERKRRKQDEKTQDALKTGHAQNGQGPMDSKSLSMEAAAITDDTADDILGSFLRKLLGGSSQSENEKAPSAASAVATGTSTSTPSGVSPTVPVSTSLPEVGDLLGGLEDGDEEREPSLVATESGSESLEHEGNGIINGEKMEPVVDAKTSQAVDPEVVTPAAASSTAPALTETLAEVADSVTLQGQEDQEDITPAVSSTAPVVTATRAEADLVQVTARIEYPVPVRKSTWTPSLRLPAELSSDQSLQELQLHLPHDESRRSESKDVAPMTKDNKYVTGARVPAMESDDSSDSYSSSSSSLASLRRRAQLVGSSPAPTVTMATQVRSFRTDSSSTSSSSSNASSKSHFSEFIEFESVLAADGVPSGRGPGRAARLACAKMSVRSKLRCSCHFAVLQHCPDKGEVVAGDEYCGSDE